MIVKEIVLNNKKNGLAMLLLFVLLYLCAIALFVLGIIGLEQAAAVHVDDILYRTYAQSLARALLFFIPGALWLAIGWIPFCGLKVLKPQ